MAINGGKFPHKHSSPKNIFCIQNIIFSNPETPVPAPVRVAIPVESVEDSESNSIEEPVAKPAPVATSDSVEDDEPRVVDVGSTSVETKSSEEEKEVAVKNSVENVEDSGADSRPPLAFVHATRPTNEDDESDAIARRQHFWRYFNTPNYSPYEGRTMIETSGGYPYAPYRGQYFEPGYYHDSY